jgi:hypothetical protein
LLGRELGISDLLGGSEGLIWKADGLASSLDQKCLQEEEGDA